jgi:hypothetical protein
MPIKDIVPIFVQVPDYAHFGSDIIFPISTCSAHTQFIDGMQKFIAQSGRALQYPMQSIRNMTKLDLCRCGLKGGF